MPTIRTAAPPTVITVTAGDTHATSDTRRSATEMHTTAQLRIRSLAPGDITSVRMVFEGMSPHSRYLRFHAPTPKLTSSMADVLAAVGTRRHVAVVAEVDTPTGGRPVGVARLVATSECSAEVAFEVVDEWQGRGVGRRLLVALRRRAADLGYRTLTALVLPENHAAAALVRSVFATVTARRVGMVSELTAVVPAAHDDAPTVPAADEMALAA
jgi:GNAT superfamily N-acetyltransferase